MKVLVAGATGAVGRPLVRQLLDQGHEVYGLTRSAEGVAKLGAVPVVADALDQAALLAAVDGVRADAVVHQLTALKKVPTRESGMAATNRLRTTGTENLLAAARAMGATRFVSQSFYGGYGYRDNGDRPLTEDAPFGTGDGPFRATVGAMGAAERMIFDAPDIEGISLRYGNFYGPGAVEGMLDALRSRKFPMASGGVVPWTYIDDAATATIAALELGRGGEAYNICDDAPASFEEVVAELVALWHTPKPIRLPGPLVRLAAPYAGVLVTRTNTRLSTTKAQTTLGWTPTHPTYQAALRQTHELLGD